jgi:hypothetical protein
MYISSYSSKGKGKVDVDAVEKRTKGYGMVNSGLRDTKEGSPQGRGAR